MDALGLLIESDSGCRQRGDVMADASKTISMTGLLPWKAEWNLFVRSAGPTLIGADDNAASDFGHAFFVSLSRRRSPPPLEEKGPTERGVIGRASEDNLRERKIEPMLGVLLWGVCGTSHMAAR
jgi:hypothetical protein